jgi:hypothetical protein
MSVEPTETYAVPPPPQPPAASSSASSFEPLVSSVKSSWSSLPQKTKLIIGGAVAAFFIFAAVTGVSILGFIGSGIFGGSIESQVSSRGSYVEQQFLKSITDLKVTKAGRDEVRLRFKLSSVNGNICGPCRFSVTMANADGEVIHYFNSQPVFQLWENWRDVDPRKVDLTYQVNPGILRRTKYVEVGIIYN